MKEKNTLADKLRQKTDVAKKIIATSQERATKAFFETQFEAFQIEAGRASDKGLYTMRFFVRRGFYAGIAEIPRPELASGFKKILTDNGFTVSDVLGADDYIINFNISWNK